MSWKQPSSERFVIGSGCQRSAFGVRPHVLVENLRRYLAES